MTLARALPGGLRALASARPSPTTSQVTLSLALFLVLFDNNAFWRAVFDTFVPNNLENIGFAISLFLFLVTIFTMGIALVGFRLLFKPLAITLVMSAAAAAYFMDAYGIIIDKTMIQNVMETDGAEALELFNGSLLLHLLLLGVLPSVLIYRAEIRYKPLSRELLSKLVLIAISAAVFAGATFAYYKNFASLSRNNRALGHMINPVASIGALSTYLRESMAGERDGTITPLGEDARLMVGAEARGRRNLVILVVGEAARAQNFSLNGYARETNPRLAGEAVINYTRVSSCGTSTAVSLPCMFSRMGRGDYSDGEARRSEGVLDVLRRAGVEVLWRDNNSGCKGACARVETEDMAHLDISGLCRADECFDEVMLHQLDARLDALRGDALVVLHQKGSHGPTYYQRYPDFAARFAPSCTTNQLQECSREEVVNAYDNTILYTDHFLAEVIERLKGRAGEFNTAMLYLSDHGESLGENNLYLHGLPYLIAPETQTRVPLMIWLSEGFKQSEGIDEACLRGRVDDEYSHDNLFHTLIGVMGVETAVYQPDLDMVAGCKRRGGAIRLPGEG